MLDLTRKTLEALDTRSAWTVDEICAKLRVRSHERLHIEQDLAWLATAGYAQRTAAERWFMTEQGARITGR